MPLKIIDSLLPLVDFMLTLLGRDRESIYLYTYVVATEMVSALVIIGFRASRVRACRGEVFPELQNGPNWQ